MSSNNRAALRTHSRETTLDKDDVYTTTSYQRVKQDDVATVTSPPPPAAAVHACPRGSCAWVQCVFVVLIPMLLVTSLTCAWLLKTRKVS